MSRIGALPWRDWRDTAVERARELTSLLRKPGGTWALRPIQGAALWELYEQQGLFGHIRVGGGKTLITALAPLLLGSRRPLLLVPGSLVGKTLNDFQTLRSHFYVPHTIRVVSYSRLALAEHANLIASYQPDLIMADEAHKLRHFKRSATAIRVARYMSRAPATRFMPLSGTLTKGSLLDYAHLLRWSLKDRSPLPLDENVLQEWADVIDVRGDSTTFAPLVPALGPINSKKDARVAFRKRLEATPGVIVSRDSFSDTAISLKIHDLPEPLGSREHLVRLRKYWEAPDGWDLADARFQVWALARQLALGFCRVIEPRPPADWFAARRLWCKFCRGVIESSDQYDSEKQVAQGCALGRLDPRHWRAWSAIKPTFEPNSVAVWFDDTIVEWVARWGAQRPKHSLIWVEHVPFGERLSAATGWSYYREMGYDRGGRHIEDHPIDVPAIASVEANATGRNLQTNSARGWGGFHRNLIVSPPNQGETFEQLMGRTHREGQASDVSFETLRIVNENWSSINNAIQEARYVEETLNQPQKLLACRPT